MKNKGTIVLLIILTVCTVVTILATTDTGALFTPAAPTQVYSPTVPSAAEKVVCIAFDDGWKTHMQAADILESYGFKATYPIITSYVGYPAYMGWDDIQQLAARGNDIVSHTDSHINLSRVDDASLYFELAHSRDALRSHGYGADVLIYPYGEGNGNWTVRNAVADQYLLALGTQTGKCDISSFDRYDVNSVVIYHDTGFKEFVADLNGTGGSTVTILYYHKVSDVDQDNAVSTASFKAQMQYLKDNGYTVRTISQQFLKSESSG